MAKSNVRAPKKLRTMWNSNAPWASSGYSMQMAEILPNVVAEGYPTACIDFYGLEGGKLNIGGVMHYPKMNHVYGSDAMIYHGQDFNTDVTFSLQDIWVLNDVDLQKVKRWIPILPIDHDPAPKVILEKLKYAYRIITYAKFGYGQLVKNGIHSTYIPHTVDTDIFKPMDKKERKRKAGLPEDAFVMGMVAANKDNPPRKSFQEVMDAFVIFLKKYPNSVLYLHTYPDFPGGFPLKQYADFLGIGPKVLYPSPYEINFNIDKQKMALIYNTLDVLLMPSISEGFGVPAIEAQACGVPVILNDFTSMPELIEPGVTGEVCEVLYRRFSHLGSYVAIPNAKSIYDCMIKIKDADREVMGKVARARMVENYDTKKVYREKWSPFLSKIEKEIYP